MFILDKFIQICPIILKVCGNPNLKKAPQVHSVAKRAVPLDSKGPIYSYKSPEGWGPSSD